MYFFDINTFVETLLERTELSLDENIVKSGNINCKDKQVVVKNIKVFSSKIQPGVSQGIDQHWNEMCDLTNLVSNQCGFRHSCNLTKLEVEKSVYNVWLKSLPTNESIHTKRIARVDYKCILPGKKSFFVLKELL